MPDHDELTTFAPIIDEPPNNIPTGNLWVSLSRLDRGTASVRTISCLHERANGMLEVWGDDEGVVAPFVEIDGERQVLADLTWTREHHWLPRVVARCGGGELEARYCAPVGERGATFRLTYRRTTGSDDPVDVIVGWTVRWARTALTQLRAKDVEVTVTSEHDAWTRSHVLVGTAGLPLLALGVQPGGDAQLTAEGPQQDRSCVVSATRALAEGSEVTADLYLAVAPERDGAVTGALHLRRRGFDDLWATTAAWLEGHQLRPPPSADRLGLLAKLNENAFFNYFFSQGDCLDTGRSTIVTSRSSDYYVSAAFWSRDAYQWSFPALLLVDPRRARHVLVASIDAARDRIADHALYLNGTSLYPGFELDQAAAPIVAVHLYAVSTGDLSVLDEPAVRRVCDGFVESIAPWKHDGLGLYATFLLPTDDPTAFPYTTTNNALVRAAFDALARLASMCDSETAVADDYRRRAAELGGSIARHLVGRGPSGDQWVWACDADGHTEHRDEPPLSLSTLPFWGLCEPDDPRQLATQRWLRSDNPFWFEGTFPGAGSPHFPYPSGFDLSSRLLMTDDSADPLGQFIDMAMDHGLGCESWASDTGQVRTGAAMASMAGLLTWTVWSRVTGRSLWHQPLTTRSARAIGD